MKIAVYGGSFDEYKETARSLAKTLADNGDEVVYGGLNKGLYLRVWTNLFRPKQNN